MTDIYEAWHYKIGPDSAPDKGDIWQNAKLLGHYTARAKTEAAIERRCEEEGFRNWPHGFRIEVTPLDVGMPPGPAAPPAAVIEAWHFRIGGDDEEDTEEPDQVPMRLGLISRDANARAAIERSRDDPRFRDFPDGFRTNGGPPDTDFWVEGFIGWNEWW